MIWLSLVLVSKLSAQEWTRFRGPNGSGISQAKTIPTKWSDNDINWKMELPGTGHSSPVLWGDKVFLTSCDEPAGQFYVLCLDANNGRKLWQKDYAFAPHPKHDYNSFASSSPTVDAERVYLFRTGPEGSVLFALDHSGNPVWEKDLGKVETHHGSGSSPILFNDMVVMSNDQDADSFLMAADSRTGETRWKTPRVSDGSNYSTPCVYDAGNGKPLLIFTSKAQGISAVAPDTGNVLWELKEMFDKRCVASPIVASKLIVASCGSGGGGNYVVAVRPGAAQMESPFERAYSIRRSAPYVPTSICVGDRLFLWSDGGILSCVQVETGEAKWQERVGGNYFGSPVCVDGRLFCATAEGEIVVASASGEFEVLARNALDEPIYSTPAVANGRMFIHTAHHLISVGNARATKTVPEDS